jgi:hypothetical protein
MTIYVNKIKSDEFMADASSVYAEEVGAILAITHPSINRLLLFKAFIKSFSFDRKIKSKPLENKDNIYSNEVVYQNLDHDSYKLEIEVVSQSIYEALANHYKMQHFYRIVGAKTSGDNSKGDGSVGSGRDFETMTPEEYTAALNEDFEAAGQSGAPVSPQLVFYLSNLMTTGPVGISYDIESVRNSGVTGIVEQVVYSPDMEMGFYEYRGRIFAKSFNLALDINVTDASNAPFEPILGEDDELGPETKYREQKSADTGADDSNRMFGIDYSKILGD